MDYRTPKTGTAVLRAGIDLAAGKAPSDIRLLTFGPNESDYGTFTFDELAAAMVIASFEMGGKPRLYGDWNHGMLSPEAGREQGAACCSFVPEVRNGELWAADIQWTEDGRSDIESHRYNYFSPAFTWEYGEDGLCRPRKLINFALVNLAGLKNIEPLLAASAAVIRQQENDAMEYEKLYNEAKTRIVELEGENKSLRSASSEVVALSAAVGLGATVPNTDRVTAIQGLVALKGDVLKLAGKDNVPEALGVLEAMKTKAAGYDSLAAESAQRESAQMIAELSAALTRGVAEGKIPPALKGIWEEDALAYGAGKPSKDGIAKLNAKIDASPKIVEMAGSESRTPPSGTAGVVALSADDKALCKRHNLSETAMLKAKQDIEDQRARRDSRAIA